MARWYLHRISIALGAIVGAICNTGLAADDRALQPLACKGCLVPLSKPDLLRHLQTVAVEFGVSPTGFAGSDSVFERRWTKVRREAVRRIDTEYRRSLADALRTRKTSNSDLEKLFWPYVSRQRLATDLSRRLTSAGFQGPMPSSTCRLDGRTALDLRTCVFSHAMRIEGKHVRATYGEALRRNEDWAALQIDYGLFLHRDRKFGAAVKVFEPAIALAHLKGESSEAAEGLRYLANVLADVDRLPEAEAAYQQALDLAQGIDPRRTGDYWLGLSTILNNSSTVLMDQDKFDAAEAALNRALSLRFGLAMAHPDNYLPNLAVSLNNLAHLYEKQSRHTEAAKASELAVMIYRHLMGRQPTLHGVDLATSLDALAGHYRRQGLADQDESASLAAADEFMELIRDGAPLHVQRAQLRLAHAHRRLTAGDSKRGLDELEEVVATYRFLAARDPEMFSMHLLGVALISLGQSWAVYGRAAYALPALKEGTDLLNSRQPRR